MMMARTTHPNTMSQQQPERLPGEPEPGQGPAPPRKRQKRRWDRDGYFAKSYASWYNAQVEEFITGDKVGGTDIEGSLVNPNGSYLCQEGQILEDKHGKRVLGVYWNEHEKEVFFTMLGRKSRHNLEAVAAAIGTKSLLEVEEYHNLLFEASQHHGVVVEDRAHFPAAHEMSDEFVAMEEDQSMGFAEYQVVRERNNMHGKGRRGYVVENPSIVENLPYRDKMTRATRFDAEKENTDTLLNIPELVTMAGQVFYNAHYDYTFLERQSRPQLQFLTSSFIGHLSDQVDHVTEMILKETFRQVLAQTTRRQQQQNRLVNKCDVFRAVDRLKLPRKKRDYFKKMPERINLHFYKHGSSSTKHSVGYVCKNMVLADRKSRRARSDASHGPDPNAGNSDEMYSSGSDDEWQPANNREQNVVSKGNIIEIEKEPQSVEQDRFESQYACRLDEDLEWALIEQENQVLEEIDLDNSISHEHVVLTFLSSFHEQNLFDDQDAKCLLGKWQQGRTDPRNRTLAWQEPDPKPPPHGPETESDEVMVDIDDNNDDEATGPASPAGGSEEPDGYEISSDMLRSWQKIPTRSSYDIG